MRLVELTPFWDEELVKMLKEKDPLGFNLRKRIISLTNLLNDFDGALTGEEIATLAFEKNSDQDGDPWENVCFSPSASFTKGGRVFFLSEVFALDGTVGLEVLNELHEEVTGKVFDGDIFGHNVNGIEQSIFAVAEKLVQMDHSDDFVRGFGATFDELEDWEKRACSQEAVDIVNSVLQHFNG